MLERTKKMTKADIAENVYGQIGGFTKRQAADMVDVVFVLMKKSLTQGDEVKLSGFGKFTVREKKSRIGRNPQTGEPLVITGRRVIAFKPSQILRDAVNR